MIFFVLQTSKDGAKTFARPRYGPDVFVHLGANPLAEYARNNLVFTVQVYKPTQAIIINTGTLKTK